jgi:hypothetical protein
LSDDNMMVSIFMAFSLSGLLAGRVAGLIEILI